MTPFEKQCLLIARLTLLVTVLSLIIPILTDEHPNQIEILITSTLSSTLRLSVSE